MKLERLAGVDVWWMRVGEAAGCGGVLNADERARMGRFRFARDREAFLAKRVLVRRVLSQYGEVEPGEWEFFAKQHGRPELCLREGWPEVSFSLSRSGEVVVCAVSREGVVGCDVEDSLCEGIAEAAGAVLGDTEKALVAGLPVDEREGALYRLWTLKEAYGKALGVGLDIEFERVQFFLEGDELRVEGGDQALGWRFGEVRLLDRYVVSVAVWRG